MKKSGKRVVEETIKRMIGLRTSMVELGCDSMFTIHFGKLTAKQHTGRKGITKYLEGEWRFWVYLASWRIEQNSKPLIADGDVGDNRSKSARDLNILQGKKFIGFRVLNNAFDMELEFEENIVVVLFSVYTEGDGYPWMLFTPECKVLKIVPPDLVVFEEADI